MDIDLRGRTSAGDPVFLFKHLLHLRWLERWRGDLSSVVFGRGTQRCDQCLVWQPIPTSGSRLLGVYRLRRRRQGPNVAQSYRPAISGRQELFALHALHEQTRSSPAAKSRIFLSRSPETLRYLARLRVEQRSSHVWPTR